MSHVVTAPLPAALAQRALAIVGRLRDGTLGPEQADEAVDLVCDMTDCVMRHFFLRPAEALGLGIASRAAIDLGVRSTVKTTRMALRQILPRLDAAQLRQVADYIDEAVEQRRPRLVAAR